MKNITFLLIFIVGSLYSQDKPNDYLPSDFHKDRREKLREKLPANTVAVFFSNPVRNRANDVDYLYHQDPNFYYLTGHKEPHSVLFIFKENQTTNGNTYNEIIFVRQHNALREMYDGNRLGKEGASEKLQFKVAFEGPDFKNYNIDFSKFDKVMFYDFKNDVRQTNEEADLYDLISEFKVKVNYPDNNDLTIEPQKNNLDMETLDQYMRELRVLKLKKNWFY